MPKDEQVQVLRLIWNEMKTLNGRVDNLREETVASIGTLREETVASIGTLREELREELGTLGTRVDALGMRLTDTEVRLATELVAVAGAVREVKQTLVEDRVDRQRLARLESRVDRLEKKIA